MMFWYATQDGNEKRGGVVLTKGGVAQNESNEVKALTKKGE